MSFYPIVAPLNQTMSGPDVKNLQDILLFLIDKGDVTFLSAVHTSFLNDVSLSYYGSPTSEYIHEFQIRYGFTPASGEVDMQTADHLNFLYQQYPPEPDPDPEDLIKIWGFIKHVSGNNLPAQYDIDIELVEFGSSSIHGTVVMDEQGYYSYQIDTSQITSNLSNYMIRVGVNLSVSEKVYSSVIAVSLSQKEARIDVLLDNNIGVLSEYTTLKNRIENVIGSTPVYNLSYEGEGNDCNFLALSLNESSQYITYLIISHQWSQTLYSISPELVYGLFRQNQPTKFEQILFQPKELLLNALNVSIDAQVIGQYTPAILETFINDLKTNIVKRWNEDNQSDVLKTATFKIFRKVLPSDNLTNEFLALYFNYEGAADFWTYIQIGTYSTYRDKLKVVAELAPISGSNPAITGVLLDLLLGGTYSGTKTLPVSSGLIEPELLAILTLQDWEILVEDCLDNDSANFYFPNYIIGDDSEEKVNKYALNLYDNFQVIYPTRSICVQISNDLSTPFEELKISLESFISDNDGFDIRTVNIDDLSSPTTNYDFGNVNDVELFIQETATVQRLLGLTSNYTAVAAMASEGVISAFHVSKMAIDDFIDKFSVAFDGDIQLVSNVYNSATTITTHSVLRTMQYYSIVNDTSQWSGLWNQKPTPLGNDLIPSSSLPSSDIYAEWRSLFGSIDACACCHCQSLYSPSAYLVDTLNFFKNNAKDVHDELINIRRPDIQHIELSCENTNTPLPQIDIVNELLEDIVSTGNYEMYARQTTADAVHLRAIPEYINASGVTITNGSTTKFLSTPYSKLKEAVYPWSNPYNFYQREINLNLEIAGIKSHEITQRLSKRDRINAINTFQYAINYAGISNESATLIITSTAITPPNNASLAVFYGFISTHTPSSNFRTTIPDPKARGTYLTVTSSNWHEKLVGRVDVFLQQTKLSYKELLRLLDCYFINPVNPSLPNERILKIEPRSDAKSQFTCKLFELEIKANNFNVDIPTFLNKLHRFVRLAKALKWDYYTLDKVIHALALTEIDQSGFIKILQIKQLADKLRISIDDVNILFADISTVIYHDYGKEDEECEVVDIASHYSEVFRNPALQNVIEDEDYPFKPDATFEPVTQDDLKSYMAGILQLTASETQLLLLEAYTRYSISNTTFTPDISFLSYLYRQAVLIKSLRITVSDWHHYIKWIGDSVYWGNKSGTADPANDNAAYPITYIVPVGSGYTAIPFDTIRFVNTALLIKETGIVTEQINYLLLDKPTSQLTDDKLNKELADILTGLRIELQKYWYKSFNAAESNAGLELSSILLDVLTDGDTKKLIDIIERVLNDVTEYTDEDIVFINNDLKFLLPAGSDLILTDDQDANYLDDIEDRYNYIYDNYKAYVREQILRPTVASYFANAFKIEQEIMYLLLDKVINISATQGFDVILDADFVLNNDPIQRWQPTSSQFMVALYLHKGGILINTFGLGLNDVRYLWLEKLNSNPSEFVIPDIVQLTLLPIRLNPSDSFVPGTNSNITYRLLRNLIWWMQVRAFTGDDINILFEAIKNNHSDLSAIAATVLKMSPDDTESLLDVPTASPTDTGILGINPSEDYRKGLTYLRIIDCLEMQHLLPAEMTTLQDVAIGVVNAASQTDASKVVHLVKAPFTNQQWLNVIQPVNDQLRIERRDALIAYLLAYPPSSYYCKWLTSNDIYETMMLDVEMMPIVTTSRIVMANNTIQLWIDRVLLQLERHTLSNSIARQWYQWRRIYRLWEANRKIFLYPENWIEPELRDDKSPFFLELENFLKNNEITKENVEEAYKTYLERLEQVSGLNVIGVYREMADSVYNAFNPENKDVIHVFARTKSAPYIYFYRKRVLKEWTPWEKMEIEINSDHFIPVMWRGRLKLYWLEFVKDQETKSINGARNTNEAYVTPPKVRWKINLGWTEYKDKKWTPKEISSEALYSNYIVEETPESLQHLTYFINRASGGAELRIWNKEGDLERIKQESINFFCEVTNEGYLRFKVFERNYGLNIYGINHHLQNVLYKPGTTAPSFVNGTEPAETYFDYAFEVYKNERKWANVPKNDYIGSSGAFNVTFKGVKAQVDPPPSSKSILYDHIWDGPKLMDFYNNDYWPANTDYWYKKLPSDGYAHFPDKNVKLLKYAPGITVLNNQKYDGALNGFQQTKAVYKDLDKALHLVFPRIIPEGFVNASNIEMPYFFYKDYNNTFFVEKIDKASPATAIEKPVVSAWSLTPVNVSIVQDAGIYATNSNLTTGISLTAGIPISSINNLNNIRVTQSSVLPSTSLPSNSTISVVSGQYRFHNYTYSRVNDFLEVLHLKGIDGLLDVDFVKTFNSATDRIKFNNTYQPTGSVATPYPTDELDFTYEGAYSLYNWELFYHIPVFIANKLSQNQQFSDARNWYHYVFNPTNNPGSGNNGVNRFWNFKPFYDNATNVPTIAEALSSPSINPAIARWAENPFNPHVVARSRHLAYMKNTVNKYLDNLIAWGDSLFRMDTRESINEATLLYVLAAQILGRRPQEIPAREKPETQTYYSLITNFKINEFGNVMVKVENKLLSSVLGNGQFTLGSAGTTNLSTTSLPSNILATVNTTSTFTGANLTNIKAQPATSAQAKLNVAESENIIGGLYYFCVPVNDKFLQYWDVIADRLFKIRNSQSIDGVTRQLALFDPPIDPAILVKAAAAGLSLSDILGDLNAPLPNYRFNVLTAKATEIANEVKSLGGQLLSALEKKDAENIALLRSSQEIKVLNAMSDLKTLQIQEAEAQFESILSQKDIVQARKDHYDNLINEGLIGEEQTQLNSAKIAQTLTIVSSTTSILAATLKLFPEGTVGPFSVGVQFGGTNLGDSSKHGADAIGILSALNNHIGQIAGLKAGFKRRIQDWQLQSKLADGELKQIDKQLIAAEIRKAIAEKDLAVHQTQVANAIQMDEAMRDKYTNGQLYEWMVTQISYTYFQAYKLAYDTAKKAEKCFRYELNLDTSDYIQYGYWDNLKKGLLAGENLSYDIKRMEVAYLDKHSRQLELTKHISLAALNPNALIQLRLQRICHIEIPEWLFDMDYPGQHMRRIKSVSISIPCVGGPYTTISCKLTQTGSKYRKNGFLSNGEYIEDTDNDSRFTYMFGKIQSIATSSAQQDSGLFELNFRDERYLPFEGTGAISKWTIELPAAYAQFDYNTISDVILHINYTALDTGATKAKAVEYVQDVINQNNQNNLYRLFDLKHEFSNEWYKMVSEGNLVLNIQHLKEKLPYLVQGMDISNLRISIFTNQKFDCKLTSDTNPVSTFDVSAQIPSNSGCWQVTLSDVSNLDVTEPMYLHLDEDNFDTNSALSGMRYCWMVMQFCAE